MGHGTWDIGHNSRDGFMSFEKLGVGGGWWWVHLDYNVSSWPCFGQKPIVRVKTRFKKLWVGGGGGGGCIWIITSALGPALVRS